MRHLPPTPDKGEFVTSVVGGCWEVAPNPYHLGEGHRYRCSESATGQFQSSDKRFSTPKMIVAKDVTTLRELCTLVAKELQR